MPILPTSSKLQPCLLEQSLKTRNKIKGLEIMCQKTIYICISWYNKIYWFSLKKCWCLQNYRDVSHDLYIFFDLFNVGYNCATFHYCRVCVTDFRKRRHFWLPFIYIGFKRDSLCPSKSWFHDWVKSFILNFNWCAME